MLVLALMKKGQYYGHHHQNCAYDIVKLMHCLNNNYLWILNLSYLNAKGKYQNKVLNKMCKRVWYTSLY
jgi:hypothetical protein